MAVAVRQYAEVANWYATGSGVSASISGLSWQTDDVIVVVAYGSDSGSTSLINPSNANLTFTARNSITGGSNEGIAGMWTAKAGSTQSSQTISSIGFSGFYNAGGGAVWILSGANNYVAGWANRNESGVSYNPSAGSGIVHFIFDWNASGGALTQATNTGTATEREDSADGSWGSVWVGDWMGVSAGTATWGVTSGSYGDLVAVTQVGIEISVASSTSATATPSAVSVSASIPAVSPTVPKNATVTPAAVSCTVAVAGGTVSASTTVAATAVAVTSTVGAPAMIGGATIAAATVAGTVSLPPPTLSAGSTIAATALAVTSTVDSVAPTTTTPVDATATPSPISSTASIARGA